MKQLLRLSNRYYVHIAFTVVYRLHVKDRAKWDAWQQLSGMEPAEAKIRYIELIRELDHEFATRMSIMSHI